MRLRLIVSFILVALVSIASVLIIAWQSTIQEVRTYMFRGGMAGVDGLVTSLEEHYQNYQTWEGVEQLFDFPGQHQGNKRGNQGSPQGMGGMIAGMMGRRLRLADSQGNLIIDTESVNPTGSMDGNELLQAISLQVGSDTVGFLLPEGGMTFNSGDATNLLNRLTRAAYIAAGVAIALSLALTLWLSSRLLRPIQSLKQVAASLSEGDLSRRVDVQGDDEMATLGRTFNKMAASLENAEANRRSMTADIAHELRTPLAVQRAHLEALQDGVYPATSENLEPIIEQNLLLTRLVDDLGTLALVDAGQLQIERIPTNIFILLERIIERFLPQSSDKKIELQFSSQGECQPVALDPGRFEQILVNLFSNAIRYTPDGGWMKINLECSPYQALITVHDNGPGLPEEDIPRIFERFYRVDPSRTRSEGGTGLGLAIARQLAEAQGGTLTAANHPDGGAIFSLCFPMNA
jgi:two-component system sensor histidine kinase BaeS